MSTETIDVKKAIDEKALDNKCPGCGAPIFFNPKLNKWKCAYCNSEYTLKEMQKFNNASNEKYNGDTKEEKVEKEEVKKNRLPKEKDHTVYISHKCKNCGAEIVADEQTSATFCVYCGSTAILQSKLSGEFQPELIIPFKTEKEQAIQAFVNLKKGRPFVPKDFTSQENIEKIKGVYIPFWLYDIFVSGSVNCDGKRITSWTRGDTRYTKTDTYAINRTGEMLFTKVPVDGSTRFANDIMNSIEPFYYEDIQEYNHAYLSGFYAEKFDVTSEDAFEDAKNRSLNSGKDIMYNDSRGYNTKIVVENSLSAKKENSRYALLPVWMVNVNYKDKMYIFAMNGQTGKFIGDIPLDKKKAWIWGILIFIGLFLGVAIISLFIHFMG